MPEAKPTNQPARIALVLWAAAAACVAIQLWRGWALPGLGVIELCLAGTAGDLALTMDAWRRTTAVGVGTLVPLGAHLLAVAGVTLALLLLVAILGITGGQASAGWAALVVAFPLLAMGWRATPQWRVERKEVPAPFETPLLAMVALPGGTFLMGSPESESERFANEGPGRRVRISRFAIGKFTVTRGEYHEVTGSWIDLWGEADDRTSSLPATHISWFDAAEFCNALSAREGLTPCYTINAASSEVRQALAADGPLWADARSASATQFSCEPCHAHDSLRHVRDNRTRHRATRLEAQQPAVRRHRPRHCVTAPARRTP